MGCDLAVQSEWTSQRACTVVAEAGLTPLLIRNWRCPEIKCLTQGHMLFGGRAGTRPVTQSLVPLHHRHALCPHSPLWTILSRWERRLSPQWELGKASKFPENTETTLSPPSWPWCSYLEGALGCGCPTRVASLLAEERDSGDVNSPSLTHLQALSGLPGLRVLRGDMEILTGPPPLQGAVGLEKPCLERNARSEWVTPREQEGHREAPLRDGPARSLTHVGSGFLFLAPSFSYSLMVSAAKDAPELPLGIWLRPHFP